MAIGYEHIFKSMQYRVASISWWSMFSDTTSVTTWTYASINQSTN